MLTPEVAERIILEKIRDDPTWLPNANVEIVTRLERRLRSLEDPEGKNRWLHHRWVGIFTRMFDDLGGVELLRPGFSCLFVGAGIRNPLAFTTLLFMAGAGKIYVVEPESVQESEGWRITWGLQEMAFRIMTKSVTSKYFRRDVSELADFVNLEALYLHGDVRELLGPGRVMLYASTLEDAPLEAGTVDFVCSRSVLEHLIDYTACFDKLANVVRPGGVMHHEVDMSSHSQDRRFAFYYRPPRNGELNELRLSDYLRFLDGRGFRTVVTRRLEEDRGALDRRTLYERFARYADEDLLCSRAVLISTKTGLGPVVS